MVLATHKAIVESNNPLWSVFNRDHRTIHKDCWHL